MSNIVTVELVMDDDQARDRLNQFLQDAGGNAKLVSREGEAWGKAVERTSAALQRMVLAGGGLYMVSRMVRSIGQGIDDIAEKWSRAFEFKALVARVRNDMLDNVWDVKGQSKTQTQQQLEDAIKRIHRDKGGDLIELMRTAIKTISTGRGMEWKDIIGQNGIIETAWQYQVRSSADPEESRQMGTALNLVMGQLKNDKKFKFTPKNVKGALAFAMQFRREAFTDQPGEFAKNIVPMVTRMQSLNLSQEEATELAGFATNLLADQPGNISGTFGMSALIGLLEKRIGPGGTYIDPSLPLARRMEMVQEYFQNLAKKQGMPVALKKLRSSFMGKLKSKGALIEWIFSTDPNSRSATIWRDIQEQIKPFDEMGDIVGQTNDARYGTEWGEFAIAQERHAQAVATAQRMELTGSTEKQQSLVSLKTILEKTLGLGDADMQKWIQRLYVANTRRGMSGAQAAQMALLSTVQAMLGLGTGPADELMTGRAGELWFSDPKERAQRANVILDALIRGRTFGLMSGEYELTARAYMASANELSRTGRASEVRPFADVGPATAVGVGEGVFDTPSQAGKFAEQLSSALNRLIDFLQRNEDRQAAQPSSAESASELHGPHFITRGTLSPYIALPGA